MLWEASGSFLRAWGAKPRRAGGLGKAESAGNPLRGPQGRRSAKRGGEVTARAPTRRRRGAQRSADGVLGSCEAEGPAHGDDWIERSESPVRRRHGPPRGAGCRPTKSAPEGRGRRPPARPPCVHGVAVAPTARGAVGGIVSPCPQTLCGGGWESGGLPPCPQQACDIALHGVR